MRRINGERVTVTIAPCPTRPRKPGDKLAPALRCQTSGCDRRTQGGKPHCLEHLRDNPYADRVATEHEARAQALAVLLDGGDPSEELLEDAYHLLEWASSGALTAAQIGRRLAWPRVAAERVAQVLEQRGVVTCTLTARGSVVVAPAPYQRPTPPRDLPRGLALTRTPAAGSAGECPAPRSPQWGRGDKHSRPGHCPSGAGGQS